MQIFYRKWREDIEKHPWFKLIRPPSQSIWMLFRKSRFDIISVWSDSSLRSASKCLLGSSLLLFAFVASVVSMWDWSCGVEDVERIIVSRSLPVPPVKGGNCKIFFVLSTAQQRRGAIVIHSSVPSRVAGWPFLQAAGQPPGSQQSSRRLQLVRSQFSKRVNLCQLEFNPKEAKIWLFARICLLQMLSNV